MKRLDKKCFCKSKINAIPNQVQYEAMTKNPLKFLNYQTINKFGFTLAEVLITLGLIGIIAAIIIPSIITFQEKQATVNGFKKAYSTLTQVIDISIIDNGPIEGWDFPSTVNDTSQSLIFFNTYLSPYFSISKRCGTSSGCWNASNTPYGITFSHSGLNAADCIKYILNDGMNLSIVNNGLSSVNTKSGWNRTDGGSVSIFVDINGFKKPNILGKDVFVFTLLQKASDVYNQGNGNFATNVKDSGIYPDGFGDTASHYEYRGCGKDVTFNWGGSYCGIKIIQDGYQIKDDYPW